MEDTHGLTPFDLACKLGSETMVSALIDLTPVQKLLLKPPSLTSSSHTSPLHLTCKNKSEHLKIVESILNKIKSEQEIQALKPSSSSASFHSPLQLVERNIADLLRHFDPISNQNVFFACLANNHLNIVEYLFKNYGKFVADLEDKNGNLAAHLAARNGSPDLLQMLIKYNAYSVRKNKFGENALHIAAAHNKHEFIKIYLAYESTYVEKYLNVTTTE